MSGLADTDSSGYLGPGLEERKALDQVHPGSVMNPQRNARVGQRLYL